MYMHTKVIWLKKKTQLRISSSWWGGGGGGVAGY